MTFVSCALVAMAVSGHANAQTLTTLLSFSGTNGSQPLGDLTISGSTLYGMAGDSIFSINMNGSGFQSLFSFSGANGSDPIASLTLSGSTLYGMTYEGGSHGDGTIFSINTNGTSFQNLYSFSETGSLASGNLGDLTVSGSMLYGLTRFGGTFSDGSVFSINTNGSGYQDLYSFSTLAGPRGSLALSGSTLYGMTLDQDNIFCVNTNGSGFRNLHVFNGTDGDNPRQVGPLTLSGSTLFGMTNLGGTYDDGTIFRINTDGSGFQSLFSFNGTNGNFIHGELTLVGNTLYGMTGEGGEYGDGNIFSINTDGTGFQDLLDFNGTNGADPYDGLTLSGSTLYGMTELGGASNDGTIFAFTLPVPEPSTFLLLTVGSIALAGYAWWRRREARRMALPEAKDDSPANLSFPSQSSRWIEEERRAA